MKTDTTDKQTEDKPKIPLPTLSQINADRITQVSEVTITFHNIRLIKQKYFIFS